ncbi:galanin peptides-like isoform 1-T2 [Anomaloglossus baeobatrachus]|uniref:galanin peptides-like n=1 Tax=Anomaloglossus baeobatrachus TaxID=238106 RepID=UPI003F508FDF
MRTSQALLCVSFLLCGFAAQCFGYSIMPKDKRGWTLNSAGYLLGPHAHRTLNDKGGMTGKREIADELFKSGRDIFGTPQHSLDDSTVQTVLEFLTYLHLKEIGALDHLPLLVSEESTQT